jgi:hypothetical protein
MRIISDFHDYYDCVQSHGQDDEIVWFRRPKEIQVDVERPSKPGYLQYLECQPFPLWYRIASDVRTTQYMIGFCGKVYPCAKLTYERAPGDSTATALCYTMEEIDTFVDENLQEAERKTYYKPLMGRRIPSYRTLYREVFERCEQQRSNYEKWFLDHHCPVFVARYARILGRQNHCYTQRSFFKFAFNAPLKKLQFYRVFDVQSAFQEIAMYYGGVLGGVREYVPDVSDDILSEAKGFDKWSFRRPPRNE